MNVFVALLRGVNVGGNNMISMSSLKKSFEAMGFPHVSTYINSGNIIFTTKENDARKLEKKIEQMLSKDYQLDSRVVLRSLPEMEKLVQSLPKTWAGDPNWRYNVIFLRHTIDSEKILDELVVKALAQSSGGRESRQPSHCTRDGPGVAHIIEQRVRDRSHDEGEQQHERLAADHDPADRMIGRGAGAVREHERDHARHERQRRHQDRA